MIKVPKLPELPLTVHEHNEWFKWYVDVLIPWHANLFKDAVGVSGYRQNDYWFMESLCDAQIDTHKALLIQIQPIKEETAEDILREFAKELRGIQNIDFNVFIDRAEKFLNREKK